MFHPACVTNINIWCLSDGMQTILQKFIKLLLSSTATLCVSLCSTISRSDLKWYSVSNKIWKSNTAGKISAHILLTLCYTQKQKTVLDSEDWSIESTEHFIGCGENHTSQRKQLPSPTSVGQVVGVLASPGRERRSVPHGKNLTTLLIYSLM